MSNLGVTGWSILIGLIVFGLCVCAACFKRAGPAAFPSLRRHGATGGTAPRGPLTA